MPVTRLVLNLRALHRWPLGTPYLDIAAETRQTLLQHAHRSQPGAPVTLALDVSGPGAPILELLRSARTRALIEPVLITSGQQPGMAKDSTHLVPRDHLLSTLRILLERGVLSLPARLASRDLLIEELAAIGQPARNRHDDLAIALALAVYSALHHTPGLRREP